MIAYIRGVLTEKEPTRAVVEACGVGYELIIPVSTYDRLPKLGVEVKLLAFHCVREDDETLFGFATGDEREMFEKLVSVNGVGSKIAIAILSGTSLAELALAVASGDVKRISAIKGVGRKTAEKICLELRDKVSALAFSSHSAAGGSAPIVHDAVSALRALGFTEEVSAKMVAEVLSSHSDADSVEKVIKLALGNR